MRKHFISLFILISLSYSYSQISTVKGRLFGEEIDEFLPYATISVYKDAEQKNVVHRLATDEKGSFSTKLREGNYFFAFQYVGKSTLVQEVGVNSNEKEIDLGKIVIKESSTQLDEVSVVAQTSLVKVEIDKLAYSLKDDPESATSNVLDMLRKVPLVTVDPDDNV